MPDGRDGNGGPLPAGRLIGVGFHLALPREATIYDVVEWLEYRLGRVGGMSESNPLLGYVVAAVTAVDVVDSGREVSELYGS